MMVVMEAPTIITLDGPAASGKSSVARSLACTLGIPFVSSGLFYRAATLLVLDCEVDLRCEDRILTLLRGHEVVLMPELGGNRVLVDDSEVTEQLHTDRIDENVSAVSIHPQVRTWVRTRLRQVPPPFVVEGRDMGSAVFPESGLKFYLTASPEVRAERRVGERSADLSAVAEAIRRRDWLDARQLKPAPGAIHIDTEGLTLDQVVQVLLQHVPVVGWG